MTHPAQPRGGNLYVRDYDLMHGPAALAIRLRNEGWTGAAVNIVHPETARVLRGAGFDVWLYGLPGQCDPQHLHAMQTRMEMLATTLDCGAFPNMEKPYFDAAYWPDAGAALLHLASKAPTGVATFEGLRAFAKHVATMPGGHAIWCALERYHRQLGAPLDYWQEAIGRWQSFGFAAVVPIFGCYPAAGHDNDIATVVKVYDSYPSTKAVPAFDWATHVRHGAELDAVKRWLAR